MLTTDNILIIGSQVCLRLEELHPKGRMEIPNCKVANIKEDRIYINTPGIESRFLEGRKVDILWEKGRLLYCMSTKIEKCIQDTETMLVICLSDMLRSIDKRRYFRLKRPIHIEYRPQGSDDLFISAEGKYVSGEGVRFLTNYPLVCGQKLEMLIELPVFPYIDESVLGEVSMVERFKEDEGAQVGIRFLDMDPTVRKRLVKYILDEKQPIRFKEEEELENLRLWFSLC